MSRTSDIDRVVASIPVDRTTARVMGRGIHWEPAKNVFSPGSAWADLPLPILPLPPPAIAPPHCRAGVKVGRLTVLGYGGTAKNSNARWVVRCACGAYGHHKAKFLGSEAAKVRAMCPRCDYLSQLKAGNIPDQFA